MPRAINRPVDGEVPLEVRDVQEGWTIQPTEIVIPDADWREGWVWEAANRRLRAPNDADRLRWAKRDKKTEITKRMHRSVEDRFSEVREVQGAWVAEALIEMMSDPRGSRVAGIKADRDKRTLKHAAIDAALAIPALDAITWEG